MSYMTTSDLVMCLNFRCSPADGADGDSGQKKSVCCHGGLPWWFIFVGWLLVIGTSVVSGYFTMLYGLKFGKKRSINWLVSMIVSFFQSTLVIQPLKVRTHFSSSFVRLYHNFLSLIVFSQRQWAILYVKSMCQKSCSERTVLTCVHASYHRCYALQPSLHL